MASGNVARILRVPGRVVINPTTAFLGGTYPYGGTEVGKASQCLLQPLGTSFRVEYESLGEVGDVLEANNRWMFTCFLRGWDDDAVELLLAGGEETGEHTQHRAFHVPGNVQPGASALKRSVSMVYVPEDPETAPAVLIYRGVPDWTEGAEMAFQRGSELGIPLSIECLRDSGCNTLRVGRLVDLSLI